MDITPWRFHRPNKRIAKFIEDNPECIFSAELKKSSPSKLAGKEEVIEADEPEKKAIKGPQKEFTKPLEPNFLALGSPTSQELQALKIAGDWGEGDMDGQEEELKKQVSESSNDIKKVGQATNFQTQLH